MTEKTLTTENIKPALDALRGELAPWPVVAKKQDRLNTAQLNAANSGITSSLVAQIIANTAAIRALESAITGTGLRALVVASLPAVGTTGILYIVPVTTYDPDTDADVVNYSNEYIWIPVEGGTDSEGHYEQVGQTGIVINNGQLTITVNGTSVGTFTANQSGDTTAAITVPTNADYVDRTTDQTVAGDKTWTAEQTFSLPIVGSITGTAAKAIADEDGTSIKSGYVNVAGNQTVSGQKTWSGNAFYTAGVYHRNNSYEIGNTPASNVAIPIYFTDKVNVHTGYVRNVILTTGRTQSELYARNKFTNGALSPTGTDVSSTLQVEVQSNGDKTLYFDGSIRNNVLPYTTNSYSLGSSSYQWSSVYAQNYYYNGTAWGLDQANVWSANQTILKDSEALYVLKRSNWKLGDAIPQAVQVLGTFAFTGSDGANAGIVTLRDNSNGDTSLIILARQRYNSNGNRDPAGTQYETRMDIGIDSSRNRYIRPNPNGDVNLGTSTNKWKTLNGVNPGALSLPDLDNAVNITSTFNSAIDKTQNLNSYTADFTGWLFVIWWTEGLTAPYYIYFYCTNSASDSDLRHSVWGQTFGMPNSAYFIQTVIPVISGKTYWFETSFTRTSTESKNLAFSVRKLPNLGNV